MLGFWIFASLVRVTPACWVSITFPSVWAPTQLAPSCGSYGSPFAWATGCNVQVTAEDILDRELLRRRSTRRVNIWKWIEWVNSKQSIYAFYWPFLCSGVVLRRADNNSHYISRKNRNYERFRVSA